MTEPNRRLCFVAPFGLRQKTTIWARTLPLAQQLVARGWSATIVIPPWDSPQDSGRRWTEQGVGFEPHVWIDVSHVIETRRRAMASHESQVALMAQMYGDDIGGMVERLARFRGGQRGVEFAEAFRGCGTYPEPDGAIRFLVRTLEGA